MKKQVSIVKKRAALHQRYEITVDKLPLSCPTEDMRIWDGHPRVFLPIEKTGHAVCPYCSAEYFLKTAESLNSRN